MYCISQGLKESGTTQRLNNNSKAQSPNFSQSHETRFVSGWLTDKTHTKFLGLQGSYNFIQKTLLLFTITLVMLPKAVYRIRFNNRNCDNKTKTRCKPLICTFCLKKTDQLVHDTSFVCFKILAWKCINHSIFILIWPRISTVVPGVPRICTGRNELAEMNCVICTLAL